MTHKIKRTLLIYLFCCMLAIILISGSLSQLEFKQGEPFPSVQSGIRPSLVENTSNSSQSVTFLLFQGSLSILFLVTSVYLTILVFHRSNPKKIGVAFLVLAGLLGLVYLLSLINPQPIQISPDSQGGIIAASPFTVRTSPLEPAPISWQWLTAFILVVCSGLFVFLWINKKAKAPTELEKIAAAAQAAVETILTGDDLRNVILYSYQQMVAVLRQDKGIDRHQAMTVREFEKSLVNHGIPPEPIHALSLVFESARYGDTPPSLQDKELCLENLRLIIDFCQRKG